MRGFPQRLASLALVLLLVPGVLSRACGATVEFEKSRDESDQEAGGQDRTREVVVAGVTAVIAVRTLYAIYVTIPISDCFDLWCDIRILGERWDNDVLLPLQPMSKLVWNLHRADDTVVTAEELARAEPLDPDEDPLSFANTGICRFVASGIFRATEPGSYKITVTYWDERPDGLAVQELLVRAE
jgi:hypothetical protein